MHYELVRWAEETSISHEGTWLGAALENVSPMTAAITDCDPDFTRGSYFFPYESQKKHGGVNEWVLLARAAIGVTFADLCRTKGFHVPHPLKVIETFFVIGGYDAIDRFTPPLYGDSDQGLMTRSRMRDRTAAEYLTNFVSYGTPAPTVKNVLSALEGFHRYMYVDHPESTQVHVDNFTHLLARIDEGAAYVFNIPSGLYIPREATSAVLGLLHETTYQKIFRHFAGYQLGGDEIIDAELYG